MAKRVGQLFSNYRLLRLLGQGSFADVYLGEHIHDKNLAAIKILRTRLTDDLHESFINEAWTLKHLTHPNIVHIQGIGIVEDIPYLAMEYAPHGTLRNRHPHNTKVPLPMIVDYVKQIAEGLQYAHDHKLIHRDMKPENLLISQQNTILISDFGVAVLAQSTRSLQTQDSFAGTISYMAPEQLQGKPRLASDQYALGIIIYEWLCGKRPFHGTTVELLSQHLSTPPPPLHEHNADISPAIEQVVLTALAKDSAQRFPSVRAFAAALEQASLDPQSVIDIALATPQPTTLYARSAEPQHTQADAAASSPIAFSTFDEAGATIAVPIDSDAPSPISSPTFDETGATIAALINSDAPSPISSASNPVTPPPQTQANSATSTPELSPANAASALPTLPAAQDDYSILPSPLPQDDYATQLAPLTQSATSQPVASSTSQPAQTMAEIHNLRKQYFAEMTRLRKQYFAEMTRLRKQFLAEIGNLVKQGLRRKALPLVVLVLLVILGFSADAIHSSAIGSKRTVAAHTTAVAASATASVVNPAPTSNASVIKTGTKPLPPISTSSCATSNWTIQLQHSPTKSASFMTTSQCHNAILVSFTRIPPYPIAIRACTSSACEAWLNYTSAGTPIVLLTNVPAGTSFYLESISNATTTFTAHVRVFY